MYHVTWDKETGGILLSDSDKDSLNVEIRPVFYEELDLLGFNQRWTYPQCQEPLLWATLGRRYFYQGQLVAIAKGGGFFEKPSIEFSQNNLNLEPVKLDTMLHKNAILMEGLAQKSIEFIYETRLKYHKKVDIFAVAFSGGKDSLALLDLAQRALSSDEFVVIFSDTTMEITPTYQAVEAAKTKWNHLSFYTAKSVKDATETWKEFGPPSRIHRWCCTVHKSAPTLLILREIANKPSIKALIFDGIRWDESQARAGYNAITDSGKHSTQINASPIIKWNSAEIFLYLFERGVLFNNAYRYGLTRVGCSVCPFASRWSESLCDNVFNNDSKKFLNILMDYTKNKNFDEITIKQYIYQGDWKSRAGGKELENGYQKVIEKNDNGAINYLIKQPNEEWLEWIKSLGTIVMTGKDEGQIRTGTMSLPFQIARYNNGIDIKMKGINKNERFFIRCLHAINNKTAYCVHCKGCEVECSTGALKINDNVTIDDKKCVQCAKCLTFVDRGCLAAKSLYTSEGDTKMRGLNRYQTFGMKKEWLSEFFTASENWWVQHHVGNRQFDAMRVWLKESELIYQNTITELGKKVKLLTADSLLTWAIIWTNLARNSALISWYLKNIEWKSVHTKNDFIELLGGSLAQRSRKNSIESLVNILKDTPIGNIMCIGVIEKNEQKKTIITKQGWDNPLHLAILYSLYRYAEHSETYNLTLRELYLKEASEGPYVLFGIAKEELVNILRGLASRYERWISVELVRDLDNIYLNSEISAIEVLNLIS